MSSYFATFYFYSKLQKFVTASVAKVGGNRRVRRNAFSTRQEDYQESDTKAVMKMVKLSTLLPLVLQGGVFVIDGSQWFLPVDLLPMWGRRLLSISFAIMPMCGPWISLLTLGPFKRELKRRVGNAFRNPHSITAVPSAITIQRMLKPEFKMHLYKLQLCQELEAADHQSKVTFAQGQLAFIEENQTILGYLLSSNKVHFHLHGGVNRQDFQYWLDEIAH
uniref:Uncharacterized protein n=1 Tax=Plectus sambesii TaxID=2011161 RepID=A0A914XTK5_9BILA